MAVRVVVVGAGVLGAATARAAARAGHDVVLVEQAEPGWERSASSDHTRIIRCAHGADTWHAASARRAWTLWHEIDPALVEPCGVAWLARRDDGYEARSEAVLRELGIPCERIDAEQVAAGPYGWALWEPEAGVLRAQRATRALAAQAVEAGARLEVRAAAPGPDGHDPALPADVTVWACGAWLPALFGDLVRVRVTQQDVFWFDADRPGPAWCDFDGAAYGAGSVDRAGVKVCPDLEGPPVDVQGPAPSRDEAGLARARALLDARFPALAGAPLRRWRSCQYELTADTRAILAPHPEHAGVWLAGGTSGHGFKHAPAWAELLLGWIEGAAAPDPAFGLGDRRVATSLRTAGSGAGA